MFNTIQHTTNQNRGISTTIGYAATLSITVILLGILVGAFSVQMNTQIDNAKEQELEISGAQLATEIEKVDATARNASVDSLVVEPQFSPTAGNEDYKISVEGTSDPNIYQLRLETPEGITNTTQFRSQTPIETDSFANSTELQIAYDASDDEIIFQNRETLNQSGPTDQGPDKTITGDYTIPPDTQEPAISASGDIIGGENSVINGDLVASDQLDTDAELTVYGSVESNEVLNLAEFTYVTGAVDSSADVGIGNESVISQKITSDGDISLESSVTVESSVDASNQVQIDEYGNITGSVSGGQSVIIGQNVDIGGPVSSSQDITIKDFSGIDGDIDSNAGVQLQSEVGVQGNVAAQDEISISNGTIVQGNITTGQYITLSQDTEVGSITATGDITTGTDSTIQGNLTSDTGEIQLTSGTTVTGDVIADSGSLITCNSDVTINGKDCSQYVDDNY